MHFMRSINCTNLTGKGRNCLLLNICQCDIKMRNTTICIYLLPLYMINIDFEFKKFTYKLKNNFIG